MIFPLSTEVVVASAENVIYESLALRINQKSRSVFRLVKDLHFFRAVKVYTRRSLTYQLDSMDAFRGYLSRCDRRTYWGIPFDVFKSRDLHAGFCAELLWYHPDFDHRPVPMGNGRTLIYHRVFDPPAWSWLSCRQETYYAQGFLNHWHYERLDCQHSFQYYWETCCDISLC